MPVVKIFFTGPLTMKLLDTEYEAWRQTIPWIMRWLWSPRYREVTVEDYFLERARARRASVSPLTAKADDSTGPEKAS